MTSRCPTRVRSLHPFGFRSGEWARILTTVPTPVMVAKLPILRDCYLVEFDDGVRDFIAVDDPWDEREYEYA